MTVKTGKGAFRRKQLMMEAQDGRCAYCFDRMLLGDVLPLHHPLRATEDHVWPRALRKGEHRNKVLVHGRCNQEKQDRAPTGCELIAREWVWARIDAIVAARPAAYRAAAQLRLSRP